MNTFLLQAAGQQGGMSTIIMMALMFGVVYFFMIRPQMKAQKKEKKFRENIAVGTRIVTNSGLHGKIVSVSENTCVIETSAGKVTYELTAISAQLSQQRFEENKEAKK